MQFMKVSVLPALLLTLLLTLLLAPATTWAGFTLADEGGFNANLNLDIGAGIFATDNSNFGSAQSDADNHGWYEGYFKPILNLTYDTGVAGSFYGGLSYVGSATRGDGDPVQFTTDDSHGWEWEQAYIGWRSGNLWPSLGENAVDISVGEQNFAIGDGFLIMDGEFDYQEGAYWIAPHSSFENTVITRINTQPLRGDVFYLESDDDQGSTELYGLNLEYQHPHGTVGAYMFTISDSDYAKRDGMDVYSLRAQGTPLAGMGLKELFLAGEFAYETGGDRVDVDAQGWYAEAGYTLDQLPWQPTLSYRYAFFSGNDPNSSDYEAFDPLFYGFGRGWGTHYMGEIVGEYYLFNSNQKVHMLHLHVTPGDKLSAGVLGYDFTLDEETAGGNDHYAQEVNVYADYSVNERLSLSAVLAWATPEDAAEEDFAEDDDMQLLEVAAFYYY